MNGVDGLGPLRREDVDVPDDLPEEFREDYILDALDPMRGFRALAGTTGDKDLDRQLLEIANGDGRPSDLYADPRFVKLMQDSRPHWLP